MSKQIEYTEKETKSGTLYTDIAESDKMIILDTLEKCLVVMAYANADRTLIQGEAEVYLQAWNTPMKDLNRGRFGANSPCSMTAGLLYNFMLGNQYDFTVRNLQDIELITHFVSDAFPDHIEPLSFREGFFSIG